MPREAAPGHGHAATGARPLAAAWAQGRSAEVGGWVAVGLVKRSKSESCRTPHGFM